MARGIEWTEEQLKFLADKAGVLSYHQIAEQLGRTESSVRSKACRLGIGGRKFGILHHRKVVKASRSRRSA